MYVKSDIHHRRRYDSENLVCNASPNHSVEMIIVEAVMNKRDKWAYVLMYKPPLLGIQNVT